MTIDADALRRSVSLPDLVSRYTELKQRGREYIGCCPFHHDSRPSLQLFEGRDQVWRWWCPPCAETGDCIDFLMQAENLEFTDACRRLGAHDLPEPRHIVPPPPSAAVEDWQPMVPVPADAPPMDLGRIWNPKRFVPATGECGAYVRYRPVFYDAYESSAGVHGYVARLEFTGADGERVKIPTPITYCQHRNGERRWCAVKLSAPRPLLGLLDLLARPEAPVLVVSGEKCSRAAKRRLPSYVVVTWAGGDNTWDLTDWSPLAGRRVVWWPDADDSGRDSMCEIGEQAGAAQNRFIRTDGLEKGYDVADVDEAANLVEFCKGRVTDGLPPLSEKARERREREKAKEVMRSGNAESVDGPSIRSERVEAPSAGHAQADGAQRRARAAPKTDIGIPASEENQSLNGQHSARSVGREQHRANGHKHPNAPPDEPEPAAPVNPFDLFSKPYIPPLRQEYIPPALAPFVFDRAEVIGGDPGVLFMSCLVACASVIDDAIKLQPKQYEPEWRESARLWGVVVGEPSTLKTPTMMPGIDPIRELDERATKESNVRLARWTVEHMIHQKRLAKHVSGEASGRPMGTAPEEPVKPPARCHLVGDTTVEALVKTLIDNPRGALGFHDELYGWIGSMDAYKGGGIGGKDRADCLELYNGGSRVIDRVSSGRRVVPNWSLCVLGGIQPSRFRELATKLGNDGMLQRFMIVMAETVTKRVKRPSDKGAREAYEQIIQWLVKEQPTGQNILMSEGAEQIHDRVEEELILLSGLEALPKAMQVQLGKWRGLFVRLCLTYHMIEQASAMQSPPARVVSEETARRVERLMSQYLLHHATAFYDDVMDRSERMDGARYIAGFILSRGLIEVRRRDFDRACKPWRKMPEWQQREVIRILEDCGWLFPIHGANPGRQVSHWAVNELAHEKYKNYAAEEEARRRAVAEKMRGLAFRPGIAGVD